MQIAIMNYEAGTITIKHCADSLTGEDIEVLFDISSDKEYYMTADNITIEDERELI